MNINKYLKPPPSFEKRKQHVSCFHSTAGGAATASDASSGRSRAYAGGVPVLLLVALMSFNAWKSPRLEQNISQTTTRSN